MVGVYREVKGVPGCLEIFRLIIWPSKYYSVSSKRKRNFRAGFRIEDVAHHQCSDTCKQLAWETDEI